MSLASRCRNYTLVTTLAMLLSLPGCVEKKTNPSPGDVATEVSGDLKQKDAAVDLGCVPQCGDKECGDDGCQGLCGECESHLVCNAAQECECPPGNTCGEECCPAAQQCVDFHCCDPECGDKICGEDPCGNSCGECPQHKQCDVAAGTCDCKEFAVPCADDCCAPGDICHPVMGECCTPGCEGKAKGEEDGCGGYCGNCNLDGICTPDTGEACLNCPEDCLKCGDGKCSDECGESHDSCASDCDITCSCGDGLGIGMCGETVDTCCPDFSVCGNNECECGEDAESCKGDCCGPCGDGLCDNFGGCEGVEQFCDDCLGYACGNGICHKGQNPTNCPEDCAKSFCPNNVCEAPVENVDNCLDDCAPDPDCEGCVCGDCKCDSPFERYDNCPVDCGSCGDGYCSNCANLGECCVDCDTCGNGTCDCGENFNNCPGDCCGTCGDGLCAQFDGCDVDDDCSEDCEALDCGNGICDPGELPDNCPEDCEKLVCGNNVCEPAESVNNCYLDCLPLVACDGCSCGDCRCDLPIESALNCPRDCGTCGDGYCSPCSSLNESPVNCPDDCPD